VPEVKAANKKDSPLTESLLNKMRWTRNFASIEASVRQDLRNDPGRLPGETTKYVSYDDLILNAYDVYAYSSLDDAFS